MQTRPPKENLPSSATRRNNKALEKKTPNFINTKLLLPPCSFLSLGLGPLNTKKKKHLLPPVPILWTSIQDENALSKKLHECMAGPIIVGF
jgi:hypothetical protein